MSRASADRLKRWALALVQEVSSLGRWLAFDANEVVQGTVMSALVRNDVPTAAAAAAEAAAVATAAATTPVVGAGAPSVAGCLFVLVLSP